MVVKERLIRVVSAGSGKDEIPFFFFETCRTQTQFRNIKKKEDER